MSSSASGDPSYSSQAASGDSSYSSQAASGDPSYSSQAASGDSSYSSQAASGDPSYSSSASGDSSYSSREALYERLKREGEAAGYYLNPDVEFVLDLMEGILANEERYGYWSCPCRLAEGVREKDLDIICPCDYRDPDLDEYGACYCALYVSEEIARGEKEPQPVPERRGTESVISNQYSVVSLRRAELVEGSKGGMPVWRCKVCGYLCARPQPPLKCPICKVDRDRFERFA